MDRYSWCQYASIRAHATHSARRERQARWFYGVFSEPDLTVFLAVTPARAYGRVEARGTDHEDLTDLAAADAAYRSLVEFRRFVVIDANREPAAVQRDLRVAVAAQFEILASPDAADTPLARPIDQ
jgi:dTMP kinase